jgi:outer membrane protein TolC
MNFKTPAIFLFLGLSLSFQNARAQALTLKQTLSEVNQNSLTVQRSHDQVDEQSYKRIEASSAFVPAISGGVTYLTNHKYALLDVNLGGVPSTFAQVVPTTVYNVSARWNIFDGFASTYNVLSANQSLKAAQNDYEWTQFQTERTTILAFYKLLAAQQIKDVVTENLKTLQDHLKDVESSKRAGVSTQYDVLKTQVTLSEAETDVISAEDNIHNAYEKLAEALGKDKEDRLLDGKLPVIPEDLVKNISNIDVEKRKDLVAMQEKSQSAQYSYQSANKHWFPKISLFGDYQYYNNRTDGFNDDANFREAYNVGISLNWNFFDGFGSYARSGASQSRAAQMSKTVQIGEIKAKNDFEFWRRKFVYFCSVYKSKTTDIDRSSEALRLAKAGRKVGVRTNTDILDAESDVNRSKIAQINSQVGTIESLINLELSVGQQLYSFEN